MKKFLQLILLFSLLSGMNSCKTSHDERGRNDRSLNKNWLFAKDLPEGDYSGFSVDDALFTTVDLPHTPNIEPLVVNHQWQGTCWYRHLLEIPQKQRNRKHFLYFEGAMQNSDIYLNGKHLSHHLGGYLPFIVDITNELDFSKENLLAVKLLNVDDSLVPPGKALNKLDFNMYGGIYRSVKLISTSKLYITNPLQSQKNPGGGIYIRFDSISEKFCQIKVSTYIQNDFNTDQTFRVRQSLLDSANEVVASNTSEVLHLNSQSGMRSDQEFGMNDPILWSPDSPYLYLLVTEIYQGDEKTDSLSNQVGIRDIQLTKEGLLLNGKKIFLNGTNRHQEYPYIGYALSDQAQWRDAIKIKNAGFDLVRLSHYPQSETFMEACDALGIVIMDCIPGWQYNGNEEFKENVLSNVRDLIRRDRNRASVFFWELSLNESWMEPAFMDRILQVKKEEFEGQPTLTCSWIDYAGYDLFIPARQHGTPPSYWNDYKSGKRPILIAEYGDWEYYAQNAGFNQTAYHDLKDEERTSRQLRVSGEKGMLQQAMNFQEAANSNRKGSSTIGHANWLMFDYNRGYADDIESSGIADIFRIPKFATYFYQSQRNADEQVSAPAIGGPVVYIASYWQPESSPNVRVFSNCDEVELLLNGHIAGRQTPDQDAFSDYLANPPTTFKLKEFVPGELKAIGFIDGKKVASYVVRTPEPVDHLQLTTDESGIPVAENDVVFIYASLRDENGTLCPDNGESITFSVEGDGELIGTNPMVTEVGIATILLKTGMNSGKILVKTQSETIKNDSIVIEIGKENPIIKR